MSSKICPECNGRKTEQCWSVKNGRPNPLWDNCKGRGQVHYHTGNGKGTVYVGKRP